MPRAASNGAGAFSRPEYRRNGGVPQGGIRAFVPFSRDHPAHYAAKARLPAGLFAFPPPTREAERGEGTTGRDRAQGFRGRAVSATLTLALTQSEAYRLSSHRVGRLCRLVADRTPDRTGVVYLGAPATMDEYGWSASTHWRAVRDAVAAGLLERVSTGGGRGLANGYRLLVSYFPRRRRNRVTPAPPTERSSPRSGTRRDGSPGGPAHDGAPRPPQPYDRPWRPLEAPALPLVDLGPAVLALRRARGWLRRG